MRLRDYLTIELDLEIKFTRVHLVERVRMDRVDFKPHDKSMTLGWLATFNSLLPWWGTVALTKDSFDVAPHGGPTIDRKNMFLDAPVGASREARVS